MLTTTEAAQITINAISNLVSSLFCATGLNLVTWRFRWKRLLANRRIRCRVAHKFHRKDTEVEVPSVIKPRPLASIDEFDSKYVIIGEKVVGGQMRDLVLKPSPNLALVLRLQNTLHEVLTYRRDVIVN